MATFSDLMSLLFTFFVLLLSFANMDVVKFREMLGSVQNAFGVQREQQAVGNGNLIETRASGQPIVGGPQSGGLGAIRSSSLEQSNVDLAAEFVRLIINQRAFQANTRTVATTNELLANLVQLGQ